MVPVAQQVLLGPTAQFHHRCPLHELDWWLHHRPHLLQKSRSTTGHLRPNRAVPPSFSSGPTAQRHNRSRLQHWSHCSPRCSTITGTIGFSHAAPPPISLSPTIAVLARPLAELHVWPRCFHTESLRAMIYIFYKLRLLSRSFFQKAF